MNIRLFLCVIFMLFVCDISRAQEGPEDLAARDEYSLRAWKNADGTIDLSAIQNARQITKQLTITHAGAAPATVDAATNIAWQEMGPDDIGGRVRAIAVHPTIPHRLFVGSVAGGIWRSDDDGAHWLQVGTEPTNLAITSIVISPSNPNIMYAATGENYANLDAIPGGGVFKSTDGGSNWTQLVATIPTNTNGPWSHINKLWVHPSDPNTVIAVLAYDSVYKSVNGGTSWAALSTPLYFSGSDIVANPANPEEMIISSGSGWINSIRITRTPNGVQSWAPITCTGAPQCGGGMRASLAWSQSDPTQVFASVDNNPGVDGSGDLYVSRDGGITFSLKTHIGHLGKNGQYANSICVDPTNPANIVVGGAQPWRSTDGGTTFMMAGYSPHPDFHAIVPAFGYNGTSITKLYFGSDGGVASNDQIFTNPLTSPANQGWTSLSQGLRITQFYSVAANASYIIGGTQDNGTLLRVPLSGPMFWKSENGGDGGFAAVSNQLAGFNYLFGESQYFSIFRHLVSNVSNGYSTTGISLCCGLGDTNTYDGGFFRPLILDDSAAPRLMYASYRIWVAANPFTTSDVNWQVMADAPADAGGNVVRILALAPTNSNLLWAAWRSVYRSDNALSIPASFSLVSFPGISANAYATAIHISTFDSNTVFVTFAGTSSKRVMVTHDGGGHWQSIDGNIPQVPIRDITQSPVDPNTLYLATEFGVFVSADAGTSWTPITAGPYNIATYQFAWIGNALIAATHGRGMFVGAVPPDLSLSETHSGNFRQGENGVVYSLTVRNVGSGTTIGTTTLTDTLPTGLTATAMSGDGWSCKVGTLTCTRTDALASGGYYSPVTLTVNIATDTLPNVTNTANVFGLADNNLSNNLLNDTISIVQIPINAPNLTITKSHTGNFSTFQTGDYILTVTNVGNMPTSGSVSVVDNLPSGLSAVAMIGANWSCTLGARPNCTRSDPLPGGNSSYPPITLTVNVASPARNVTNTATVSGGGTSNVNTANDPTTIIIGMGPPPPPPPGDP